MNAISANPYMQYFLGVTAFQAESLFDSSMMVHFRKRFPVEEVAKINEYICTGAWTEQQRDVDHNDTQDDHSGPSDTNVQELSAQNAKKDKNTSKKKLKKEKKQKKNRGKLIMDAAVAPADIK